MKKIKPIIKILILLMLLFNFFLSCSFAEEGIIKSGFSMSIIDYNDDGEARIKKTLEESEDLKEKGFTTSAYNFDASKASESKGLPSGGNRKRNDCYVDQRQ